MNSRSKIFLAIVILIISVTSVYALTACAHGGEEPMGDSGNESAMIDKEKHEKDHPVDAAKVEEANERAEEQTKLLEEEALNENDFATDDETAVDKAVIETDHPDCF